MPKMRLFRLASIKNILFKEPLVCGFLCFTARTFVISMIHYAYPDKIVTNKKELNSAKRRYYYIVHLEIITL
jgi:hypothetical protein